ncbi:MAG: HAD-IIB family hydrolase [Planctomycetota bacterium]
MTDHPSPWLVVSDVDDTLTGDGDALQRLHDATADRATRKTGRFFFALNSSRPADSVDRTVRESFPQGFAPDAVVTAMGTQVRVAGEWVDEWTDRFADWPRQHIVDLVLDLGHRPHADEYQTPHKASFAVPRGDAQTHVLDALDKQGLAYQAIASGGDDFDLLPPEAGKDKATLFLREHLGVAEDRLVVCGDSANDLAMFHAAPHAIAVANARPELLDRMPKDRAYHAAAPHAAGVHEGLVRLGIL